MELDSEPVRDTARSALEPALPWDACPVTSGDVDDAVSEVFQSMLGTACTSSAYGRITGERISATIRMSGGRQGMCVVEMPAEAGDWLTDSLMGSEADWDDEMIHDAVGELCNMITGGVKRRMGSWLGECRISLPEVWHYRRPETEGAQSAGMRRFYAVGTTTLLAVTLTFYRTTD